MGGASLNPRISGDGSRIVFESKADNLIDGAGIAKIKLLKEDMVTRVSQP